MDRSEAPPAALSPSTAVPAPSGAVVPRLIVLVGNVGIGLMAMTICLPSMPAWETVFDTTTADVQLTYSAYLLAFASMQLLCGPLSDRFGRRPVILAGLAVVVAGSLLAAAAPTIELLIAARAIQAGGATAGMVVGRALVQDMFDGADRTRTLAYMGIAMGATPPVFVLLGGYLHAYVGWQSTFLFVAGAAALLLIASAAVLPRLARAPAAPARRKVLGVYLMLLRDRPFLFYALAVAGCSTAFYVYLAGTPAVLNRLGVAAEAVGWYLLFCTGAYVAGNFLTTRIVHTIGERRLLGIGEATAMAGPLAALAIGLTGNQSAIVFLLPLILMGFGHGMVIPPSLTGAIGQHPEHAGAAAAVSGAMQQAGGAIAAYALGLFAVISQATMAVTLVAVSLVAAAAVASLLLRHVRAS
jgi:DHA1 family bicyclomycin/chloramphenicol resistance-like MFS transporter